MGTKAIGTFFGKYMAGIVLAVTALALFLPETCLWIRTEWINYLLMVVMFGMGLTLKPDDFKEVFRHPKNILLGCIAQFTIMPLLALLLGKVCALETGLLAGMILVVFVAVALHNLLGYIAGFLLGTILGRPLPQKKALSIEIGMQNSGLATSLAGTAFPNLAMATVPGAIFSVWHNISGAILANVYRRF